MHCRGFQGSEFNDSGLAANTPAMLEPAPQVEFDLSSVDFGHLHRSERGFEGFERGLVSLVRLRSANRRLGIVLQEKVRPFTEEELLALANNIQRIVVSGLEPFAQLPLCFLPVLSLR
jgi:hypothetical protein